MKDSARTFFSLCVMYLRSFYNLPSAKTKADGRLGARSILKGVGIAALVILVLADVLVLFISINVMLYQSLAPLGMQSYLLVNAAVTASLLTFVIGFMTILSTYFLNDMELMFLSMPVSPFSLLGAKYLAIYVSQAAFSVLFMGSALGIYGWFERPSPLFYVWGFLAALLLPLPGMTVSYLIQVPLLGAVKFLRNKQAMLLVGGILGLIAALGFNVYYQGMMSHASDAAWVTRNIAGPGTVVSRMASAYLPAQLVLQGLTEPASGSGMLSMLGLLALCVGTSFLALIALAKPYAGSLPGFNEQYVKKLGKALATSFLASKARRGNAFVSLVKREFVLMNREPSYLLNGPFVVVLMPLIMIIMFAVQKDALFGDPDLAVVLQMIRGGSAAAVIGLAGAFLGSATSITCTALSRDAKSLGFIRSLPISAGSYMLAKLVHGLLFALFGSLTGVLLPAFALRLGLPEILTGLTVALGLSFLVNMLGLILETVNPRLSWDNPIAALKQNPNAVIAILGEMGLTVLCGFAAFKFQFNLAGTALWLGALPFALFLALLAGYPKFAEKRLSMLEP